jgi:hypothetical protein
LSSLASGPSNTNGYQKQDLGLRPRVIGRSRRIQEEEKEEEEDLSLRLTSLDGEPETTATATSRRLADFDQVNERDETETKTMSGDLEDKATLSVREKKECCRRWCHVPVLANAALTSHQTTGRSEESG